MVARSDGLNSLKHRLPPARVQGAGRLFVTGVLPLSWRIDDDGALCGLAEIKSVVGRVIAEMLEVLPGRPD